MKILSTYACVCEDKLLKCYVTVANSPPKKCYHTFGNALIPNGAKGLSRRLTHFLVM